MKKPWFRQLIRGLSFTSALFIFQACYGTPQDFGHDLYVTGNVKAKSTGLPIKGIKVSVPGDIQYEYTDDSGSFSLYTGKSDSLHVKFEDFDGIQNGLFQNLDTVIASPQNHVILNVRLEEK